MEFYSHSFSHMRKLSFKLDKLHPIPFKFSNIKNMNIFNRKMTIHLLYSINIFSNFLRIIGYPPAVLDELFSQNFNGKMTTQLRLTVVLYEHLTVWYRLFYFK